MARGPDLHPRKVRPLAERFWLKVDKRGPDECWEWLASKQGGYGQIGAGRNARPLRAHRVAWELANGRPIPEGMAACHTCDNPGCVNPSHIFIGTICDNNRDAYRKGRSEPAKRRAKGHCVNGHERTEQNIHVRSDGAHICKVCERERAKRRWKENREARLIVGAMLVTPS